MLALRTGLSLSALAMCGEARSISQRRPILQSDSNSTQYPVVELDYGSFQGNSSGNITTFLGMPYAAPPTGDLRFAPPQSPHQINGTFNATQFGASCSQQRQDFPKVAGINVTNVIDKFTHDDEPPLEVSEDCLFVNVIRPSSNSTNRLIPVVFWIYGGGFESGSTTEYDGKPIIERSILLNEPIMYVSANYRLNAFGFLGGDQIQQAKLGNIGLRDQRFALRWVQKYIAAFGGDPKNVTIWGESAGAISVGLHMVINDGDDEGLFHGAFMESGGPMPLANSSFTQQYFDRIVQGTGCSNDSDPIGCLRNVAFDDLAGVVNQQPGYFSYESLQLVFQPAVDGDIIVRNPQTSLRGGNFSRAPFVIGNCDDEGTLFSFGSLNVTSDQEYIEYITTTYLPGFNSTQIDELSDAYPEDIRKGSPFDTGILNAITPQYKRIAAIQGDLIFQAPRRYFLEQARGRQPTWAFLYKRGKSTPFVGSFHSSDLPEFFATSDNPDYIGTDALINFVNTLNPNMPLNNISLLSNTSWPEWGSNESEPPIFTFVDDAPGITLNSDTYRQEPMAFLTNISLQLYADEVYQ